jgi:hypothetical protein
MQRDLYTKEIEISQNMVEIDEQNVVVEMILKKATESQLQEEQG